MLIVISETLCVQSIFIPRVGWRAAAAGSISTGRSDWSRHSTPCTTAEYAEPRRSRVCCYN